MLTGTIINTLAIVAGSLIGLAIQAVTKHSADDVSADSLGGRLQALVMQGMALCVLYIGISGSLKGENTLVIIISIALGAVIGELLDLDAKMHALGDWVQKKTARLVHTDEGSPSVADGFVTASLLFCVGAMADILEDISLELEDLWDSQTELEDGLDVVSDDLEDVEDAVYGEDDDEDESFDNEYYEDDAEEDEDCYATTCPTCEETIYFDESVLEDGEVICPNCGEKLEFDMSSLEEDNGEDNGNQE